MPGLIVFRRRWSAGSDDLVVPATILFTVHLIWISILIGSVLLINYDTSVFSIELLWYYKLGYISVLFVSLCTELAICIVSMRGSILDTGPRASMSYWLYLKLIVILTDVAWLSLGIVWLVKFYLICPINEAKDIMLGLVISNWVIILFILVTIWCTFDAAGRSWVKMKKYQRSMRESESRFNYKRSGSMNRNWRQRKVIRAYQDSWDHRCRLLFCCMGTSERNRNSFADIAKLLSDFFRELDVVPSDVVAGLVLLRKFQKIERQAVVRQRKNGTYEFLSGVPITERTQFLKLNDPRDYDHFQIVIHYMHYALGAYGWPMFLMTRSATGICQLCSEFRCCLSCCRRKEIPEIVEDNCCYCNYAALKRMVAIGDVEVIYTTFHVDVGETPFFVSIDYTKQKIVVSIRGTLSMKDVLTDLNAEGDVLPLNPPRDDWLGHKGMVQAAVYIKNKLQEENLIQRALFHNPSKNTPTFGLVLVGHSLGAGTAAILAILLKQEYPSLECYSYSPPGGLLSMPAVEYTKSFITSVVVGKDVVPRIGLHQMETLRADLINAIKRSVDPKWKTIACTMICCCCGPEPTSVVDMESNDSKVVVYEQQRTSARKTSTHPNDSSIALTLHNPLYPPGRIIHIVRHHPTADEHKYEQGWRQVLKSHEPVYQAIWVDNVDFDEVLISPAMIQDHMPDTVLNALNKVITTFGPRKPQRQSSNTNSSVTSDIMEDAYNNIDTNHRAQSPESLDNNTMVVTPTASHTVCLETSFTSLQSALDSLPPAISSSSKASSVAGSLFGRSQLSSILQYDVSSLTDGPSEATTVVLNDPLHFNFNHHKGKNVAFDITRNNVPSTSSSHMHIQSPGCLPKGILQRQSSAGGVYAKIPSYKKHANADLSKKADLDHDDWYGMAPLASPETLSEISSISSRASLVNNFAASIENYLNKVSLFGHRSFQSQNVDDNNSIESDQQMHTPTIMRRTPKVTGNLSTCADDLKLVDTYKRMGKVFITNPEVSSSSDLSEQSFESASSSLMNKTNCDDPSHTVSTLRNFDESSKSADNLDGTNEILSVAKLTMSDSAILNECSSKCPICPCKLMSQSECCNKYDHSYCVSTFKQHQRTNTSSSDTYHSAISSLTTLEQSANATSSPNSTKQQNIPEETLTNRSGILESHFPVYLSSSVDNIIDNSERLRLLSSSPAKSIHPSTSVQTKACDKRVSILKNRVSAEDRCFSRNESLPLLSNLTSDKKSPTSYVKRKKYVYPMASPTATNVSPTTSKKQSPSKFSPSTRKGESSV